MSVRYRLEDAAEAIRRIEQEQTVGREAFEDDPKSQVRMVHHILLAVKSRRNKEQTL